MVPEKDSTGKIVLGVGSVRFLEMDAEKLGDGLGVGEGREKMSFDYVWISEAMSHLPNKELFFSNAALLLRPGGRLVVADWFKNEGLSEKEMDADIKPIEGTCPFYLAHENKLTKTDGMLLPPLSSQSEYVKYAEMAGLSVFAESLDISQHVKKTWDLSLSLIQNPSLWAFAITQGRDGLAFLQAFRAMRRGYANGTFRYAVMVFGN